MLRVDRGPSQSDWQKLTGRLNSISIGLKGKLESGKFVNLHLACLSDLRRHRMENHSSVWRNSNFFLSRPQGRRILADKQKRTREDQFDQNVMNHLDSLGIRSVRAYKQWCSENGFSRRLKKSQADRRKERAAVVNRKSDTQFKSIQRARLPRKEAIERIFAGELSAQEAGARQFGNLCHAIQRIKSSLPESETKIVLESFQHLYRECDARSVKFLSNSRSTTTNSFRNCSFVEALSSVAIHWRSWIRPIESWKFRTHNQRRQFTSLIDHLFGKYDMPKFFYSAWFQPDLEKAIADQWSFIHVAKGGNIRKTELPIHYTKRMSHFFMKAPSDCSFRQALRWGQVIAMGGDETLARAVLGTFMGDEFSHDEFWRSVINWFILHPMFDRDLFGGIVDYLNNQRFGVGNLPRVEIVQGVEQQFDDQAAQPNLQMNGRTPESLMREVERWHGFLHNNVGVASKQLSWQHSGFKEFRMVEGQDKESAWTINQLLSSIQLANEGAAMKHCVGSYVSSCHLGRSSIWSMCQHQSGMPIHRKLTIEVRLPQGAICQIRGLKNRRPTEPEMAIIHRWAQSAGLRLLKYI